MGKEVERKGVDKGVGVEEKEVEGPEGREVKEEGPEAEEQGSK
mgnify:CR=1 FL=1